MFISLINYLIGCWCHDGEGTVKLLITAEPSIADEVELEGEGARGRDVCGKAEVETDGD